MAFVVCEPCLDCKYTDCVTVCPVDCFHEAPRNLYIDPRVCIDCGLCVPECPVAAIFDAVDVPAEWQRYIDLNAVEAPKLPGIGRGDDGAAGTPARLHPRKPPPGSSHSGGRAGE